MTIINGSAPTEEYIKELELRFQQTAKRYREQTVSKLKIRDLVLTNRFGTNNDLLVTIEINKFDMFKKDRGIQTIETSNGLMSDNIALLIEREIFFKHRWFLSVVSELSLGNYYEHHHRQIDPSDEVVSAGPILETVIFVQKPFTDITTSLAYRSRGYCSL